MESKVSPVEHSSSSLLKSSLPLSPTTNTFVLNLVLLAPFYSSLCSCLALATYYTVALVQSHARMILKWPFFKATEA